MTHQPALPTPSGVAERRRAFRTGCAMALALAIAGNAGTAGAQSFQGTGATVLGTDALISESANRTDIFITSEQTVINWQVETAAAAGNPPTVFQPENTTANFEAGSGVNGFTVLNRILPYDMVTGDPVNRAAQFNGSVTSAPNGSIWFYSPSGIVVGSTASFNVGNLVLTSNDIDFSDGLLLGPSGEIRFRGAASSLAPVEIQAGAVINAAAGAGAYVAVVAPRVVQAGTISVDGQVALVAAEQADIRINAGLLDIVVTQGTTDPNGIVHTGSSGGAASTGTADTQILSLIAMPKNTALTMLLSGSIGYIPAGAAVQDGSSVVLSAGYGNYLSSGELAQNLGNIQIANTQFTSYVSGVATNAIDIAPVAGSVAFEQGALLTGFQSLSAIAQDGESISSGQPLFLNANQGTTGGMITVRAEGGATGGEITATGGLYLAAIGEEDFLFPQFVGAIPGTGGTITLEASGGRIAADLIRLEASGLAGGGGNDLMGADGTGGTITTLVSGGGSITATDFSATAGGFGGDGNESGGDGVGGSVSLLDQDGVLDFGLVVLSANGGGGGSSQQNGDAQSGTVLIDIASGTKTWSDLTAEANARGGEPFIFDSFSGSATGRADAVTLHVGSGATLNVTGSANLAADAFAGGDGVGNSGTAGGVSVLVDGGGTLRVENAFNVHADASVSTESLSFNPRTSPTLTGGTVSILADGGSINVHDLRSSASAFGIGATDAGGVVRGGTNTVGAANGGTISTFAAFSAPGFLSVSAQAYGSNGPSPADAFGGTATLYADGGTLNLDDQVLVSAAASSASNDDLISGRGFAAQGGTASVELRGGGGSLNAVGITILADGDATRPGSVGFAGDGRNGTGGTARLSVAAGTLTTTSVALRADGLGGESEPFDGSVPFQSGDGFGGTASLITTGGTTNVGSSLLLLARGFGGGGVDTFSGGIAPLSGSGTGGNASALLSGGSVTTASLLLDAQGSGGLAGFDFSGAPVLPDGGDGTGGSAQLVMPGGSTALLNAGTVQITANGVGAAGGSAGSGGGGLGNGGSGTGGSAGFNLADGSFTLGTATVVANGIGGTGGTGGNGVGGVAAFLLDDSLAGGAPRTIASLSLFGRGVGGTSDTGPAATETAGQAQLTANAGSAAGAVSITGDFIAEATGGIAPAGNGFVANIGGAPFSVGGNSTITTTRDVSMTIGAGGAFATLGTLNISTPRNVTASGLVSAGSDVIVSGNLGIAMTDLISGGTTLLTSSAGPVTVSNDLSSTGIVTALGTSVDISSLSALSFADIAVTGDVSLEASGGLLVGTVDAAGNVTLASIGGALQMAGPINGSSITLSSAAGLNVATVETSGNLSLTSTAGAVQATEALSGADIRISAAGGIQTAEINATGTLQVTGGSALLIGGNITGGSIALTVGGEIDTLGVTGSGNVALTSTGGSVRTSGAVSGAGVVLTAAGDVQTDADVLSTAALQVQADGTFRAGARVVGADVIAQSADIAIGANGSIGQRGTTQAITLRNSNTANRTYMGGTAQSGGYSLDATEARRLFADNSLAFESPGGTAGNVANFIVGDLTLNYGASGNIGSGGVLKIFTPGRVEVSGEVALTTSSNADRFSIDPTRIDIITDTGGIIMRDSGGALVGQLELVGGTIAVASNSTLAQIANLSTPGEINAVLDAAPSSPNDAGYLQAGNIIVQAETALYIANTGISTEAIDRRGFTANSISIATGSAATHISINGVIVDSAGLPVTGLDTPGLIDINGSPAIVEGQFDPLSTINGCVIAQACGLAPGVQQTELTRTKSDIEVPLDPDGSTPPEYLYILEIEQQEPDDLQPLVDEPVTGVGNDDLWMGNCGPDAGACPQGGSGQ
jgi:filamentous hemagglutinin family protein